MIPIVGAFGGMLLLGEHPQRSDLAAFVLVVAAWRWGSCHSAGRRNLAPSARVVLPNAASGRYFFGTPVRQGPVPDLHDSRSRKLRRRLLAEKTQDLPEPRRGLGDGQRGGTGLLAELFAGLVHRNWKMHVSWCRVT